MCILFYLTLHPRLIYPVILFSTMTDPHSTPLPASLLPSLGPPTEDDTSNTLAKLRTYKRYKISELPQGYGGSVFTGVLINIQQLHPIFLRDEGAAGGYKMVLRDETDEITVRDLEHERGNTINSSTARSISCSTMQHTNSHSTVKSRCGPSSPGGKSLRWQGTLWRQGPQMLRKLRQHTILQFCFLKSPTAGS